MKADEVTALRAQTLSEGGEELAAAAAAGALRPRSAAVRCWRWATAARPPTRWISWPTSASPSFGGPPRRALDLTEDAGILTALANDIGTDAIFSRQVIAYGRPGDVLVALSTSGNSLSVVEALGEARRRGPASPSRSSATTAGAWRTTALADHVVVSRSEHIPRVQEAQATAYHVLRELVERP